VFEAFDRIQVHANAVTRDHLTSARNSLNLELLSWSNRGFNLWKLASGSITLTAGVATYTLPATLADLTEVYFSQVNGFGAGYNSDRIMLPITREQYAEMPNKMQPGTPTVYWFQRLATPQITVWQPPQIGSPTYQINWYGLQFIEDAGIATGEWPDVVPRALDALCAKLTARLAEKFAPQQLAAKEALAEKAWSLFATADQEPGAITIRPNISRWRRR